MNETILTALPLALIAGASAAHAGGSTFEPGAVYTSTNEASGNRVAVFARGTDGALTFDAYVPTGGLGTGEGLGNQAGVTLTSDERFLLVVNAGSDEISVFRVLEDGLALTDVAHSFGDSPVSVAQHDDLVYVVNGASDSIAGFLLSAEGELEPMFGSVLPLSQRDAGPAQIGFHPRGGFLYVTEKDTSRLSIFEIGEDGLPKMSGSIMSEGVTPFGFAFGLRAQLFVSEAAMGADGQGSLSSYLGGPSGALRTISPAVANHGTATCWVVVSPDGRRVYASNTGTSTIASYAAGFGGSLTLLDPQAAATGEGPVDMALTRDGGLLYVLNATAGTIGSYAVGSDASLSSVAGAAGRLPEFASGLAVR